MIGQTLVATAVPAGLTGGAIAGEEAAIDSVALEIPAASYLTTGALQVGESGDAGGLAEFTAECWYKLSSSFPTGTVDIMRGPTGGGGSVQWRLRLIDTGAVSATMVAAATYTATTAAGLVRLPTAGPSTPILDWYHLVAAVTGGFLRVYVNGVQQASTAVSGTMPTLDSNAEMRIHDSAANQPARFDEVAFYRYGLSASRIAAHYQAGQQRGFPIQNSGVRLNAILDAVESHAPRRTDTGDREILAMYMRGQDPLTALRATMLVEAPDGMLFVARDGTIVSLDSSHRAAAPYNTVQATFDDDGTDLPYLDLALDYSDGFLRNHMTITRAGVNAVTQEASDATSISRYLKRPAGASDVPLTNDTDALNIATALIAKYKEPLTRITSLEFTTGDPAVAEAAFRRDLGDRIRVFRTPPGGGARIDQTLFIQKIEISGANDGGPWRIRWGVSPL